MDYGRTFLPVAGTGGKKERISFGEDKQDCGYVETEMPMEYTTALEHSSFVYNGLEHGRSVFLWQMKSRKEKKIRQGVERKITIDNSKGRQLFRQFSYKQEQTKGVVDQRGTLFFMIYLF